MKERSKGRARRVLYMCQRVAVLPLAFDPLPLGAITPNGWLQAELGTEAAGLAGSQYDFYSWVHDSLWTGGSAEYSALNEGLLHPAPTADRPVLPCRLL